MTPQYAYRAQKSAGIADGPTWELSAQIPPDTSDSKCFAYSSDGNWHAYASASGVHLIPASASSSSSSRTIEAPGVLSVAFSPLSTTLFTFERPYRNDGNEVHRNVKAWDVATGEEKGGWNHKSQDDWIPVITGSESHRLLPSGSDLVVFSPALAPRPSLRLKGDGAPIRGIALSQPQALPTGTTNAKPTTPYSEPAVAIWFGEKKGAPGGVRLYPLTQLVGSLQAANGDGEAEEAKTANKDFPPTLARKAFYKADKLTIKWNNAGTMALFLTHTDVDASGKSYYGETNLYLVSLDGSFDGMVDLDKEGPIYDFAWSPTSRDFAVCYGYMPARTQLYDNKCKPVHSFGSAPRNFISYQPQGKLLLSAGFGNLAGGIDVWDISTRNKVAEFTASNSSSCEWSPCGQYILTATLSPRLRVDNGVKVWWCGGQLLHIHPIESLYQASWQPQPIEQTPSFPAVVPAAPEANESVALHRPKGKGEESNGTGAPKPTGAYRPPGARGILASDAYKRDENEHSAPTSGTSTPTPMFRGGKPAGRYVPGAPPPGSAPPPPPPGAATDKKKRVRSKRPMKDAGADAGDGVEDAAPAAGVAGVTDGVAQMQVGQDTGSVDDAIAKKIRGLNKKLKAIDDLKERLGKGETLEKTQLQKIDGEKQIRAEISALGGTAV